MEQQKFIDLIRQIIRTELENLGLLQGDWHLGKVASVNNSKSLSVFVDGSTIAQTVSCNPSVTFQNNDEVWVIFINGNSKDKFVISKRAV